MLNCKIEYQNCIAILRLQKKPQFTCSGLTLDRALDELKIKRCTALLFDLSQAGKLSFSDLGTLIEAVIKVQQRFKLAMGICAVAVTGLHKSTHARLKKIGLDNVLAIFSCVESALSDPIFKAQQLRGFRTVFLCAENKPKMAPLCQNTAVAMLDFLGKSVLEHAMDHATRFGLTHYAVSTGDFGENFPQYFRNAEPRNIFYLHEHAFKTNRFSDTASSSLATLTNLHEKHSFFENHTVIVQGDILSTLNIAEMMQAHKKADVDVTFSMHNNSKTADVIIIRPSAAGAFSRLDTQIQSTSLIDCLKQGGLTLLAFKSNHERLPMHTGKEYFAALRRALENPNFNITPAGQQVGPGQWIAPSVKLGRNVSLSPTCHIGANTQINSGAALLGTCVVGKNSIVERKSVVRDSVLWDKTNVKAGAIVDQMIVSSDWAINHNFADGSPQNRAPLDGVCSVYKTNNQTDQSFPRLVKKIA